MIHPLLYCLCIFASQKPVSVQSIPTAPEQKTELASKGEQERKGFADRVMWIGLDMSEQFSRDPVTSSFKDVVSEEATVALVTAHTLLHTSSGL